MKTLSLNFFRKLLFVVIPLFIFFSCTRDSLEQEAEDAVVSENLEERYIVVFHENSVENLANKFPANYSKAQEGMFNKAKLILEESKIGDIKIEKVFSNSVKGAVLRLSQNQVEILTTRKEIKYIEKDRFELMAPPCGKGNAAPCGDNEPSTTQQVPYGIKRVGGISNYNGNNVVWVIDSGIDINHPDLNVDESRGFRGPNVAPFVLEHPFDDDNGHGTHVAGTIAAINNDFGVIGVAPGATVIPIKVLGENNYGWWSDIIAGVDYVAAHASPGDVVNMSIGGGPTQALDDAILMASKTGIWFILAAGNNANDANLYSPSRVNGEFILTISAIDINDDWVSFSNYGNPPVDFAAPGLSVLSTYPGNMYISLSGTSMAAPHAAGVLLIAGAPGSDGSYMKGDPDGSPDPIIVYVPEPCEILTWYLDSDNDGYGINSSNTNISACEKPSGSYVQLSGDCNDLDASEYPGAPNVCKDCDSLNNEGCEAPAEIILTATGYKVKGFWKTDLQFNFSGAVDIFRNEIKISTINSTGSFTDVTSFKGSGSLTYKVCEAGTTTCSNQVTVQF